MKQISNTEKKNREKLFRLMQENPDLPVIPFVDTEVVAGDEAGKFDCNLEDTLEKFLTEEAFNALPDTDAEHRRYFDALPWVKAIIVHIRTPEVEP